MNRCETCGNHYDKAMEIRRDGKTLTFDCFECAIQALAPACEQCHCRIIGHGVEVGDSMFCSAHCARESGKELVRDRA